MAIKYRWQERCQHDPDFEIEDEENAVERS